MTKRMSRSIGAVALSVGLSVCLIASWPHAGSAQNADNSVCYTSVGERIKKIADTFAVHAKPAGNTSQWQAWDRRFWARTERLVKDVNERAKTGTAEPMIQYDLYMASSRAMLRRSGAVRATGTICTRSQIRACRSRNYSAPSSVTPERLAEIVLENTLRQLPDLPRCQAQPPAKQPRRSPNRRFHNV